MRKAIGIKNERRLKSMKKTIISIVILLLSMPVKAGLFGPSSYEDCLSEVSKTAKTDSAVSVGVAACRKRFPQATNPPNAVVKWCYATWTGQAFIPGVPEFSDRYTEVRFSSNSSVYIRNGIERSDMRKIIESNFSSIKAICTTATLN